MNALKRATVETLSITPRNDGRVEIVLRILSDHERLVDCAAQFIRAGCQSYQLTDVFEHATAGPLDFSALRDEVRPANDGASVPSLLPPRQDIFSSLQRIEQQLINFGEAMLDHDLELKNGMISVHSLVSKLKAAEQIVFAKVEAAMSIAASVALIGGLCGHKALMGLIDLTPTFTG